MIVRPKYLSVPVPRAISWSGGAFHYSEKMDGVWAVKELHGATICGEQMRDGRFFAFDILRDTNGQVVVEHPFRSRLACLTDFCRTFNVAMPASGNGGEFLEAVLARNGEGIVAKPWDTPYGEPWFKSKRRETIDFIVSEKHQVRASIRLSTVEGEDRGWCPCGQNWFRVSVGDCVEVSAYSITSRGKLREPVFVRTRHDKAV